MTFACLSEDFHPYECDGPGKCIHCDRRVIQDDHDPETCPLCEELGPLVSELEDWEMSR